MNFSKPFLIEGNDLSNLIKAAEEIIEASSDKRKGSIAHARRLITKTVQSLNTFDLGHTYTHAAAAYREATQQEQLPVDKKQIAGYRLLLERSHVPFRNHTPISS